MKIEKHFLLCITLLLSATAVSAQNNVANITNIIQNDSTIEITVTSTKHFNAGANPYVLHISDQAFSLSKEPENGEGKALTFYVPINEFRELVNGAEVTLVYGFYQENTESQNRGSKTIVGKNWQVGKLDKTVVIK